jgi:hypothetical protein
MIIYRPHRGHFNESLDEAKEFNNELEMKQYIVEEWRDTWKGITNDLFDVDDIVINKESTNDNRIGWKDTHYVCVKRIGEEDYMKKYGCPQCIGYCATNYKEMG